MPQGGLEDYDVTVLRIVETVVRVQAKNETSAALQADQANFRLPEINEWAFSEQRYVVRDTSGNVLYEGDAGEFT